MVGHGRAPGVEHRGQSDAGAEMLGIGGDPQQRLGRCLEQQIVDHGLVVVGDIGDLRRQGEDQMEVADRQEFGLAGREPVPGRRALAFGTVPVAAGIVGDPPVVTVLTSFDMAAEGGRAAALDSCHDLELAEAHMARVGPAPGEPMAMEDIGDLQSGAAHGRRVKPPLSPGLPPMGRADRAGSSPCRSWSWRPACRAPSYPAWRAPSTPG